MAVFFLAPAASAQQGKIPRCAPYTKMVDALHKRFGEVVISRAFAQTHKRDGTTAVSVMETYVSKKGTFTIIFVAPSGMTCVGSTGEDWEDVKPDYGILGDPT